MFILAKYFFKEKFSFGSESLQSIFDKGQLKS